MFFIKKKKPDGIGTNRGCVLNLLHWVDGGTFMELMLALDTVKQEAPDFFIGMMGINSSPFGGDSPFWGNLLQKVIANTLALIQTGTIEIADDNTDAPATTEDHAPAAHRNATLKTVRIDSKGAAIVLDKLTRLLALNRRVEIRGKLVCDMRDSQVLPGLKNRGFLKPPADRREKFLTKRHPRARKGSTGYR
ncbi:MAG: hypothetical protein HQM16_08385 [Deltaproteobacteria bacterium]|nr:hypothetical protein [Deltaproteobacteria bacterium]